MLQEKIDKDYIQAMKDKNKAKAGALSFLRAQIKNAMIDQKVKVLEDTGVIAVIKKQIKQRQDSIEQYEKGGRLDLVEKESQEMEILKSYLPAELSDEELHAIIASALQETQAKSLKDMGQVMKDVMEKTAGRSDNKKVSQWVKEKLSQL